MSAFDPAAITAAILAGGEGRRVGGADKGLMLLDGNPLVTHVLAA
ncbi:MAG: NTP transferase domain-containing protein, partial [Rudaea sp.]